MRHKETKMGGGGALAPQRAACLLLANCCVGAAVVYERNKRGIVSETAGLKDSGLQKKRSVRRVSRCKHTAIMTGSI